MNRRERTYGGHRVLTRLALTVLLVLGAIPSCVVLEEILRENFGDCERYEEEWADDLAESGMLLPTVPDSVVDYAMAMILNTDAVNELFRRLDDNELPVLSESLDVLGMEVTLSVQPDIPLLHIGGNLDCPECFQAEVEFLNEVDIAGFVIPGGSGTIGVQMPIGFVPLNDQETQLVAHFQELEVLTLEVDFGDDWVNSMYEYLEPAVTELVTAYLQWRFEDAPIATFASWQIGQGEVYLAPRGPYIFPQFDTMVMPMQTNLDLEITTPIEDQIALPDDADVGLVFHPELLVAMAKRMNYENVIPQGYDLDGNEEEDGPVKVTLESMTSDDMGLLATEMKLWFLQDACGTATMSASMEMSISDVAFSFSVGNFHITDGEGVGLVLSESDWLVSTLVNALLETMEITINYDQMFGGEEGEQAGMGAVQFNIDGRGLTLYFNLLEGF
jgi:hypothetical protein